MNRVSRGLVGVVVILLLGATNTWAQATAQINGTVVDSSGGVLPGVTVTAIQTETGFGEAVTDETGSYALLNLPLGPYRLEAMLSGFRAYAQTGIVLQVGSNPLIPVTLQLGSVEETVSVERRRRSSKRATPRLARSSTTNRSRRCRSKDEIQ